MQMTQSLENIKPIIRGDYQRGTPSKLPSGRYVLESEEVVDYPKELFINRNRDFVQFQQVLESPPRQLQQQQRFEESVSSTRDSIRIQEEMYRESMEKQYERDYPRNVKEIRDYSVVQGQYQSSGLERDGREASTGVEMNYAKPLQREVRDVSTGVETNYAKPLQRDIGGNWKENPPQLWQVDQTLKKTAGGYVGKQAELMREKWRTPENFSVSEFITRSQVDQFRRQEPGFNQSGEMRNMNVMQG